MPIPYFEFRPMELNARRMADVNDRLRPTGPIRDNNGCPGFSSQTHLANV
jgi:hypothetical protein